MTQASPDGAASLALTLSETLIELFWADWPRRRALIRSHPELLNRTVAARCTNHDPILGGLIGRAVQIGLESAERELDLALQLEEMDTIAPNDNAKALAIFESISDAILRGAVWLAPHTRQSLLQLYSSSSPLPVELWPAARRCLYATYGADEVMFAEIGRLTQLELADVLHDVILVDRIEALARASAAYLDLLPGTVNDATRQHVSDVCSILESICKWGVIPAVAETYLVLDGRGLLSNDLRVESPTCIARHAEAMVEYDDLRPSTWMESTAIMCIERALETASQADENYALYAANAASMRGRMRRREDADDGGIFRELTNARLAIRLSPRNAQRHTYITNYAALLQEGFYLGDLGKWALRTSNTILTRLLECNRHIDEETRIWTQSILSSSLTASIRAGILEADRITDAIDLQRGANASAKIIGALKPIMLSDLASAIAVAVDRSVLPPSERIEAIESLREALRREVHQSKIVPYQSNLSDQMLAAFNEGTIPGWDFQEAVDLARQAAVTALNDRLPQRAAYCRKVASALVRQIDANQTHYSALEEAIQWTEDALRLADDAEHQQAELLELVSLSRSAASLGLLNSNKIAAIETQARRALESVRERSLSADTQNNLAVYLRGLVNADLAPASTLFEVIELIEHAIDLVPAADDPRLPMLHTNLANAQTHAVKSGETDSTLLRHAMRNALTAWALVDASDPQCGSVAANVAYTAHEAFERNQLDEGELQVAMKAASFAHLNAGRGSRYRARYVGLAATLLIDCAYTGTLPIDECAIAVSRLIDEVWDELRRVAPGRSNRESVLRYVSALTDQAPAVMLAGQGPEAAVVAIEALRNQLYSVGDRPELPVEVTERTKLEDYYEAAAAYETAEQHVRDGLGSHSELNSAKRRVEALLEELETEASRDFRNRPTLNDICRGLPPRSFGIYLFAHHEWGAALAVTRDGEIRDIRLPDFTYELWSSIRTEEPSAIYDESALSHLWHSVIVPIWEKLGTAHEWIIVPVGLPLSLPLHAAGDGVRRADDLVTISVTPSLLLGSPSSRSVSSNVVAVTGAWDLTYIPADRAVAAAHFAPALILPQTGRDDVLRSLVDAGNLYMAGHGEVTDSGSVIICDDGPLTADEIDRLPRRRREIAVLNVCSVGHGKTSELLDEHVGVTAAFLHAGFRCVYGTSWVVEDVAAFAIGTRVLQIREFDREMPDAEVVRRARGWARNSTISDLKEWIELLERSVPNLPNQTRPEFERWLSNFRGADLPLSQVRHWGAYGCYRGAL